jgi:uncharacterized repeat protein (TIGR02543 family)
MKKLLLSLLFPAVAAAQSVTSSSSSSLNLTVPGGDYAISFEIDWACDDFPQNSAPGRIDLLDSSGTLVSRVDASTYRGSGDSYIVTGPGSISGGNSWVAVYAPNGTPADAGLTATWTIPGLPAGNYTVRLWSYITNDRLLHASTVWTTTLFTGGTAVAPPPVQYILTTGAGSGGTVSPGGTFDAGTMATVTAFPDAAHDFAGWTGDAGGAVNPVGILMTANKTVQAAFVLKSYALTTSASAGGSVTSGGSYPLGTTVTISAIPDATHYFTGWTGDAGGTNPTVAVTIDRAKSVLAVFGSKAAQTITFTPPGDHANGSPAFPLTATASSGLPVTFTVVSGPAMVTGNTLSVIGPGTVTVQASQSGDALNLAAPPVTQTFNVTTVVVLKYQAPARTLLQSGQATTPVPYVLQP